MKHTGVLAINGYLNSSLVVGILTFILSFWISSVKAIDFTIDTKILEVNLIAFAYRLFHEDFSSIDRTFYNRYKYIMVSIWIKITQKILCQITELLQKEHFE